MDVPVAIRVSDLRREIEGIEELNKIYHFQRHRTLLDRVAFDQRRIRLEEIKRQLAALRPLPWNKSAEQ
jgi:hypothetical protein